MIEEERVGEEREDLKGEARQKIIRNQNRNYTITVAKVYTNNDIDRLI